MRDGPHVVRGCKRASVPCRTTHDSALIVRAHFSVVIVRRKVALSPLPHIAEEMIDTIDRAGILIAPDGLHMSEVVIEGIPQPWYQGIARVGNLSAAFSPRPASTRTATTSREHPLGLAREPLAAPFGIGARIFPAHVDHRMVVANVPAGAIEVGRPSNLRMSGEKCSVIAVAHFAFVEPERRDDDFLPI